MTEDALTAVGWERLRHEGKETSGDLGLPSLELDASTPGGTVRIAIGPDEEPRLLLPLRPGDPFPVITDTQGIELKDRMLLLRGRLIRFAQLASRDRQLDAVFEKLTADVVRRLRQGSEAAGAVEEAVADFRALLLSGRQPITSDKAIGLLGELLVLNRLLEINSAGWEFWNGPLGARHDFRAGDLAIEVKASFRAHRRVVEISALDQLCAPEGGELILAHHILEHDAAGEFNVSDEAERAISIASDTIEMRERLSAAGYASELKERWSAFRFSLLSTDFYRVADGFPRLTPASFLEGELPQGVSHFRYRVDLVSAASSRVSPEDVRGWLERMGQ